MTEPRPFFAPIALACGACGHRWDDWQPQLCPIETWVAHVKTYGCPHCGRRGHNVLLRAPDSPSPGSPSPGQPLPQPDNGA